MSFEPRTPPAADWTAAVETAVGQELERRRSWMRAYLALMGVAVLATLGMVVYTGWSQPRVIDQQVGERVREQVTTRVAPLQATTERLQGQDVSLARHQLELASRIGDLQADVADLQRDQARTDRRLWRLERLERARQDQR